MCYKAFSWAYGFRKLESIDGKRLAAGRAESSQIVPQPGGQESKVGMGSNPSSTPIPYPVMHFLILPKQSTSWG